MINALHLLWIIPISAGIGMFLTALIVGGTRDDH